MTSIANDIYLGIRSNVPSREFVEISWAEYANTVTDQQLVVSRGWAGDNIVTVINEIERVTGLAAGVRRRVFTE